MLRRLAPGPHLPCLPWCREGGVDRRQFEIISSPLHSASNSSCIVVPVITFSCHHLQPWTKRNPDGYAIPPYQPESPQPARLCCGTPPWTREHYPCTEILLWHGRVSICLRQNECSGCQFVVEAFTKGNFKRHPPPSFFRRSAPRLQRQIQGVGLVVHAATTGLNGPSAPSINHTSTTHPMCPRTVARLHALPTTP